MASRLPYPSDVSDDEWPFVLPYATHRDTHDASRKLDPREVFNAPRYLVRTGCGWRYLPTNFPPWHAVYEQTQRWFDVGVFEAMVQDLRVILRILDVRHPGKLPESLLHAVCPIGERTG